MVVCGCINEYKSVCVCKSESKRERELYSCSAGAPSSLVGGSKWMGLILAGFFTLVTTKDKKEELVTTFHLFSDMTVV